MHNALEMQKPLLLTSRNTAVIIGFRTSAFSLTWNKGESFVTVHLKKTTGRTGSTLKNTQANKGQNIPTKEGQSVISGKKLFKCCKLPLCLLCYQTEKALLCSVGEGAAANVSWCVCVCVRVHTPV